MGKLYPIRGVGGGGGVRPKAEKKIVSVGAISTFRHPLDCVARAHSVELTDDAITVAINPTWCGTAAFVNE